MGVSPAEYMELLQLAEDSASLNAMNAVAVVFAYVTAAYLVGAKLSRIQAFSLTVVYTLFYLFPVNVVVNSLGRTYRIGLDFIEKYPDTSSDLMNANARSEDFYLYAITVVFSLSWLLSIVFMLNTRRKGG